MTYTSSFSGADQARAAHPFTGETFESCPERGVLVNGVANWKGSCRPARHWCSIGTRSWSLVPHAPTLSLVASAILEGPGTTPFTRLIIAIDRAARSSSLTLFCALGRVGFLPTTFGLFVLPPPATAKTHPCKYSNKNRRPCSALFLTRRFGHFGSCFVTTSFPSAFTLRSLSFVIVTTTTLAVAGSFTSSVPSSTTRSCSTAIL